MAISKLQPATPTFAQQAAAMQAANPFLAGQPAPAAFGLDAFGQDTFGQAKPLDMSNPVGVGGPQASGMTVSPKNMVTSTGLELQYPQNGYGVYGQIAAFGNGQRLNVIA